MRKHYDVAVIGGGLMGLSTSYYLTKRGKRVLLVEKNELGNGASGACDEMILLQSKKPGSLLEMAIESLEMYRSLSAELDTKLDFEVRGGMVLIENSAQLKVMEEFIEGQRRSGLDVEIVDAKTLYQKQPHLRKGMIASTYSPTDAQVYPLKVMKGFLGKGKALGLEVRRKTEIVELNSKSDHWQMIFSDGTEVESEYVVNAAGAWASEIGKLVDMEIPIDPIRGQILITEPIPAIGETNAWSAEYIVRKIKPECSLTTDKRSQELGIGFAISQSAEGNFLIGSSREKVGYCKDTTSEVIERIAQQVIDLFPIFREVHMIRTIAGLRPATSDGKPILGEVKGKKGFFMAAGHEGDGVALAPLTGKLIADLIQGKGSSYNLKEFSFERFHHK